MNENSNSLVSALNAHIADLQAQVADLRAEVERANAPTFYRSGAVISENPDAARIMAPPNLGKSAGIRFDVNEGAAFGTVFAFADDENEESDLLLALADKCLMARREDGAFLPNAYLVIANHGPLPEPKKGDKLICLQLDREHKPGEPDSVDVWQYEPDSSGRWQSSDDYMAQPHERDKVLAWAVIRSGP